MIGLEGSRISRLGNTRSVIAVCVRFFFCASFLSLIGERRGGWSCCELRFCPGSAFRLLGECITRKRWSGEKGMGRRGRMID